MSAIDGLLKLVIWDRVWALLLDATIKATLLLIVATIAGFALRKSSAAARHRLWALTMLSLILLPLLPSVIPVAWPVVVPQQVTSLVLPRRASEPRIAMPPMALVPVPAESFVFPTNGSSNLLPQQSERYLKETEPAISDAPAISISETYAKSKAAVQWTDAFVFGSLVWLCGAVMYIWKIAIGTWRDVRFRAASSVLDDRDWNVVVDETKRRLRLTHSVQLREHPEPVVPTTHGVLRPIVVLPRQAHEWPEQLKRFVLLHELAHVKRRDVAFQWLGRLVCALYWFHPLAWFGLRQLRRERELACDDLVVHCGERATEYAEALVSVAKNYQAQRVLTCAVAMARHGNLEGRMRSLFDKDIVRSHKPLGPIFAIAMLVTSALAVGGVSAMQLAIATENDEATVVYRPDEEHGSQEPEPAQPQALPGVVAEGIGKLSAGKGQYRVAGPLERTVKVIDKSGNPVEGAKIIPWGIGTENGTGWRWLDAWPEEFATDADGIATVLVPEKLTAMIRPESGNFVSISFCVEHPNFAPEQRESFHGSAAQPVTLSNGVTVAVKAIDSRTSQQIKSDLYAVSSGYPNPEWTLEAGLLRSTPFNPKAATTGQYFRIIYAPNDDSGKQMMFSDVIDASLLSAEAHIASPDVELRPSVELLGSLSKNVERPVKIGGRVIATILSGPEPYGSSWEDTAPIAEDGTFKFAALPRDSHVELIAVCDGWVSRGTAETVAEYNRKYGTDFSDQSRHGTEATPYRLDSEALNIVVNMEATEICKFKVVNEQGNPIDLATIMLSPNQRTRVFTTFLGRSSRTIDALRNPDSVLSGFNVNAGKFAKLYTRVTNSSGIAVVSDLPTGSQSMRVYVPGYEVIPDPKFADRGNASTAEVDIKAGELNQKVLRMRKAKTDFRRSHIMPTADGMLGMMLRIVDADGVPLPKAKITLVNQDITTLGEKQAWPADWPHGVLLHGMATAMIRIPSSANVTAEELAKASIWIDIEADGCVSLKNYKVLLSQRLPIRLQAVNGKSE